MVLNQFLFLILLSIVFETGGREMKNHGFRTIIFHVQIFQIFWNLDIDFGINLNPSGLQKKSEMEITSKVSLKLTSKISAGLSTLDTAHMPIDISST